MRSAPERLHRGLASRLAAFGLVVVAAVGACTVDDEEPVPEPKVLEERACPTDSVLTYENFGGPFISSYCAGCHSKDLPDGMRQEAPLDCDFDTLDATRAWAKRIWARAGDHNITMPPIGGPEEDEREMLGEWLACGAPALADSP